MRRTLSLAILLTPVLSACTTSPPKLAEGLPGNVTARHDAQWDQRLRERFPVGSEESLLLAELRRQHFKVDPARGNASYPQPNLPCRQDWWVNWKAEGGLITEIAGEHNGACL